MPPVVALHASTDELRQLSSGAVREGRLGVAADLDPGPEPDSEAVGLPLAMAGDELPVIAWHYPLPGGEEGGTVLIASRLEDLDGLSASFIPLRLAMQVVAAAGQLVQAHELGDVLDLSQEAEEAADLILFEELLLGEGEEPET